MNVIYPRIVKIRLKCNQQYSPSIDGRFMNDGKVLKDEGSFKKDEEGDDEREADGLYRANKTNI